MSDENGLRLTQDVHVLEHVAQHWGVPQQRVQLPDDWLTLAMMVSSSILTAKAVSLVAQGKVQLTSSLSGGRNFSMNADMGVTMFRWTNHLAEPQTMTTS